MNKNVRKVLRTVAAASMAAGLAFSASSMANAAPKITVAAVFGGTYDSFWSSVACGAAAQAKAMGVTYKPFVTVASDDATLNQSFNSARLVNPNGIIINPLNPDMFATQQKAFLKKGVPVVTINGASTPAQYRVVGTAIGSAHLAGIKALVPSGAGKIAIINGVPGLVPVDSRLNPVIEAVANANPRLLRLDPEYTFFDKNKASSATTALLVANPDIKVIIAGTGPDGEGVAAAVKAAGLAGKVTVIALDATPGEVSALRAGVISALVAQSPTRLGALQMKTVVDYLKKNPSGKAITPSATKIGVPQKLLTTANVGAAENKDWIYKTTCK
jgi:ribose transport system substrate-binding protein